MMTRVLGGLIHDAENECETSTENIRALNEVKIQHEQLSMQFKVDIEPKN